MHLATFELLSGAVAVDLECFDEGLVPIGPKQLARVGLAFGAIGGAASGISAMKQLKRAREAAVAEGRTSAASLAQATGAEVIAADQVGAVRLEKGPLKQRKLLVSMQDGATVKYVFAANKVSVDDVARVFGQIFGERFTNTLA